MPRPTYGMWPLVRIALALACLPLWPSLAQSGAGSPANDTKESAAGHLPRSGTCWSLLGWRSCRAYRGSIPLESPYGVTSEQPVFLPLLSSHPVYVGNPEIKVAAIFLPTFGGNPQKEFCHGVWFTQGQTQVSPSEVLVVVPFFAPVARRGVHWGHAAGISAAWQNWSWQLLGNTDPYRDSVPANFTTSADALDALVAKLRSGIFPNLAVITMIGFSAGGQFAQRYSMISSALLEPPPAVPMRVIVAAADTYGYFDTFRPGPTCRLEMSTDGASRCTTFLVPAEAPVSPWYNQWKWGLDQGVLMSRYLAFLNESDEVKARVIAGFPQKDVHFFVGMEDVCNCNKIGFANAPFCFENRDQNCTPVAPGLHGCCDTFPDTRGNMVAFGTAASLQGSNRLQRARLYVDYLAFKFPGYTPKFKIFKGGHSLTAFLLDPTFREVVYKLPQGNMYAKVADAQPAPPDISAGPQEPTPPGFDGLGVAGMLMVGVVFAVVAFFLHRSTERRKLIFAPGDDEESSGSVAA